MALDEMRGFLDIGMDCRCYETDWDFAEMNSD